MSRTVDAFIGREGWDIGERLCVLASVAAWHADHTVLTDCVTLAATRSEPRRHLEEALLQGTLFFGFPRAISALSILSREWPVESPPRGGGLPISEQQTAGESLFDTIYGAKSPAVREMLRELHGEFHDFVLEAAYGRILTRPGLSARIRELCAVAVLAAMEQLPQMIGHARGALRLGATHEQLYEALFAAIGDEDAITRHLRRIGNAD